MGIREDIRKIPELENAGLALVDYIESLVPGITFELKSKRWIPSFNFVTLNIQYSRSKSIAISLRGNPKEFIEFEELPLREGMGSGAYTECTFQRVNQLPALAMHIRKAYEIKKAGRSRIKKSPQISNDVIY